MADDAPVRDELGRFVPGNSGNPKGRIPLPAEIRNAIRSASPRAVEVLIESLESPDERIRVVAARELLDRGYGKPATADEADTANINQVHLEALKALAARSSKQGDQIEEAVFTEVEPHSGSGPVKEDDYNDRG